MDQHTNKFIPKKDEVYREDWFPTNIFWIDHPTAEKTNSKLKRDINKWHDRDTKGIVRSNSLGWHSAVDMHHRTEYNHFTKWLLKSIEKVFNNLNYHESSVAVCDNMWANINLSLIHI